MRIQKESITFSMLVIYFLLGLSLTQLAMAGGRGSGSNISDHFFQNQSSVSIDGGDQGKAPSAPLGGDALGETPSAPLTSSCTAETIDPLGSSLVVANNIAALATPFNFNKTLQKIIDTSPDAGSQATTPTEFIQSMLDLYNVTSQLNAASNVSMDVDPRAGEAGLSANSLVAGAMFPTALFNRFDLTAGDGSHCGEYRIIYALDSSIAGRLLIIFEAKYPNPQPNSGLIGCWPVADFWASLDSLTEAEQLNKLEQFYYQGIDHLGVSLPAAINFSHFAPPFGQVRTNNFVSNINWLLREFRTGTNALGKTAFVIDTVKNSPLVELYEDSSAVSGNTDLDSSAAATFLSAFESDFIDKYMTSLLRPELLGLSDVVNGVQIDVDDNYNEFQSDGQGVDADVPTIANTNAGFVANIQTKLDQLGISTITPEMVINRAGVMTCGGCHKSGPAKLIAPGLNWPEDAGFVHVTESGSLSPALTTSFLPARQAVLGNFVCNPPFAVGDLVRLMRALAGEIVLSQAFEQLYDINSSGDLEVGDVILLESLLFEI